MKKVVFLMFILLSTVLFSQKIKYKKGYIEIDKKQVVKMEETDKTNSIYTIYYKNNTPAFTVQLHSKKLNEKNYNWLTVENTKTGESTEANFEWKSIMSAKTSIARVLVENEQLINSTGINSSVFDQYFSNPRVSDVKLEYQKQLEQLKEGNKIVNEFKPYIDDDGVIRKGGNTGVEIGKVKVASGGSYNSKTEYSYFDLDNNKIASFNTSLNYATGGEGEIVIIDQTRIPFNLSENALKEANRKSEYNSKGYRNKLPEREILDKLIISGYFLGNQYKDQRQAELEDAKEEKKERIAEARATSINIYNQKGWAIDKKGEKIEGNLTLIFEEIPEEKDQWGSIEDVSKTIGQKILVEYVNKKGKTRYKDFMSKNKSRACLDSGDCYSGFPVKGSAASSVAGGLSSLKFDTSYFYKEIDVRENIGLYSRQYGESDISYVIKLKNEKRGIELSKNRLFDKSETDSQKNKDQLLDYLGSCSKIQENIDSYDLKTKEGGVKIINDFESCN